MFSPEVRSCPAVQVTQSVQIDQVSSIHFSLDHFETSILTIQSNQNEAREQLDAIKSLLETEENRIKIKKTICHFPENVSKNRPRGILPNDHQLIKSDGTKHQTIPVSYLNGNIVTTPSFSEHAHIATQGPLKETIPDLFNVMIEKESSIIVSIVMHQETKIVDGRAVETREKCSNYWEQEVDLGNGFRLLPRKDLHKIEFEGTQEGIVIRELQITKEGKPFKSIYQYHYQNWPDHGAPRAEVFFQFNELINDQTERDRRHGKIGPVTSHCSAGCGRTGTFLAVHFIREFIQAELTNGKTLDQIRLNIPQLVFEMKLCRHLIESPTQYNAVLTWTERYVKSLQSHKKITTSDDFNRLCPSFEQGIQKWKEISQKIHNATWVIFVRHGETDRNTRKLPGGRDIKDPLTLKGQEQAREAGRDLKQLNLEIFKVVSSSLKRSVDTAKLLSKELEIEDEPLIIGKDIFEERALGNRIEQMQTIEEYGPVKSEEALKMRNLKSLEERLHFKLESGMESLREVHHRYQKGLEILQDRFPGKVITVSGHGNAMKDMFMEALAKKGYEIEFRGFDLPNGKGRLAFIVTDDRTELVGTAGLKFVETKP